ncbi:MAG: hypothetical protein K0R26_1974 [Bacteroidota bacterium]|jgi:hypothetical protein|nr:hypothetical protein [Bacteroidota bacterium]
MEKAKLIIDLIGMLIWPTVVMTIVLIFRKQIIIRLKDIKEVEFGGFKAKLNEIKVEALTEETTDALKNIDSEKNISDGEKEILKKQYISDQLKRITHQIEEPREKKVSSENIDIKETTLLAFTANTSRQENLKYNLYYDPTSRNHNSPFKYIGLYASGEIFAVGTVKKIAYCDYKNGELIGTYGFDISTLTTDEYNRIKGVIENTKYYNLDEGHKFFLVDEFNQTHYIKSSDYALRSKKYFWLDDIPAYKKGMSSKQIAELLNGKTWE